MSEKDTLAQEDEHLCVLKAKMDWAKKEAVAAKAKAKAAKKEAIAAKARDLFVKNASAQANKKDSKEKSKKQGTNTLVNVDNFKLQLQKVREEQEAMMVEKLTKAREERLKENQAALVEFKIKKKKAIAAKAGQLSVKNSARASKKKTGLAGIPRQEKETPKPENDDKYTEAFFQQWLDQNKTKLQPLLPKSDASQQKFFEAACQHVQDCVKALAEATAKRNEIQKQKPVDQDALDKANKAVDAANAALEQGQTDAQTASDPLLDKFEQAPMADATYQLLLATNVLVEATPKGLAQYCAGTTEDHKKALVQLLQDPREFPLLQSMVLAGGAKHGKWGQALELYNQLQFFVLQDENKALWQRMALAIALELADPILVFGHKSGLYINPVARFLHYRNAWQFGELDPVFGTEFGVWELRMALNSVAPEDQLSWGREMLRNYRPDLMQLNDKWRYCRVVRTDVFYTGKPNWDSSKPLDFKQVLSGGGECGPRAWMGRFICRAFGIPTWGVREPGHAAMSRWTKDEGWVVCLGAPMKVAWWENEGGLHFQAEAAARKVLQPKDDLNKPNLAYGQKVMALEWIANVSGEAADQVVRNALVDPKAIWRSLSLMQMKRLAPPPAEPIVDLVETPFVPRLEHLQMRNCTLTERIATAPSGIIVIPASTCTTKPSGTIMIMDSFLGGKQLFLDKDGHAEYTLVSPPAGKYHMTCHIVTVHDDKVKPPLLVTIDAGDDMSMEDEEEGFTVLDDIDDEKERVCSVYSIPLQCTWGMWEETKPVVVELPAGVATCQISVSREATSHGLVIKDFKLVPLTCK